MHLLAEGLRKIATLAYLIANDSIVGNILFWDEPESNLNPKLMRQLAEILVLLAQQNTQIFIATHSLFLLREFELLLKTRYSDVSSRYFGLTRQDNGSVTVSAGDEIDQLDSITALDAEIQQSEDYYRLLAEEMA